MLYMLLWTEDLRTSGTTPDGLLLSGISETEYSNRL